MNRSLGSFKFRCGQRGHAAGITPGRIIACIEGINVFSNYSSDFRDSSITLLQCPPSRVRPRRRVPSGHARRYQVQATLTCHQSHESLVRRGPAGQPAEPLPCGQGHWQAASESEPRNLARARQRSLPDCSGGLGRH